nr:MAG TPA: minor capsid protein [Caudoviricetes sp.]
MEIKNNDGNFWIKAKEVEGLYHELSMEIMKNIVRRLKQRGSADLIDNPYVWQLEKLNDMHLITEENVKLISKYSGVAEDVFRDVIANEGYKIYQDSHQQLAQALKSDATPNPLVQDSLNSLAKQTMFEVNNLINTTLPKALQKNYKQTLESAVASVVSGTKSDKKALSEAVLKMYERGFTAFRDRGGRMWTVERYAKTVIRTTTFRVYREMRERSADELGIDTYYYSAKSSARELCAPLQHQIVTKGVARTINGERVLSLPDYGYGSPGGCLGINCGHYLTPFVVGVNYKPQLPEYLQNLTENEAKQNALDRARLKAFDREIRINKDKQILAKELGDKELQTKLKLKEKTFKTGRKSLIEKNPTVLGDIQNRRNTPIRYNKESTEFKRQLTEQAINIEANKVIGSEYNKLFISKEVKNKKQSIRYYDNQINRVLDNLHVSIQGLERPSIIIVGKNESKEHVIASYNRRDNTLFVRADLSENNKLIKEQQINGTSMYAYSHKASSSLVHELGHWYQQQNAIKNNPNKSYGDILRLNRKESHDLVVNLVEKGYNISEEISIYAFKNRYNNPEEVFAEKFVKDYFER